jgi:hypothetical protein
MRQIALPCLTFAAIGFAHSAVAAPAFWTANDPFVGKWKLDISRSTIVDDMRVDALGPKRFAFIFEGGPRETIVADGTDQPGLTGTTLAVKAEDARNLTVVRKQDGRITVSAHWKLAPDGRSLRDSFTGFRPDGSKVTVDYLYKRMSGSTGFAGDWESTTKPADLSVEFAIEPYDNEGFSFVSSASTKNVTFDGREHAARGTKDGSTFSGRRRGARAMEYTEMTGGKIERQRRFEVSSDGRTLTETLHIAGQAIPDVLVFARE